MNLESLYLRLPIWAQNWACSWEGARIERTRYGGDFAAQLAEYEARSAWSAGDLAAFRDERLRAFLRHCYDTVPFYREQWDALPFDHRAVTELADLAALPILDKATVRANYDRLLSTAIPERDRIIAHTSGTTGAGLRFAVTAPFQRAQWAVWWRYRRWHGIDRGIWCGYFGGRSLVPLAADRAPFWRINRPGRQIMFSGYHVSPRNLPAYVAELNRRQPPWLHGYPSLLAVLAGYLLETGRGLDYQVRWITTGAENLLAAQTALIERAFAVRPRQHYGMSEGVANISETPEGILRVDEDFAAVEFVPQAGGGGVRIIGTNISNAALPLVRYDVGDVVEMGAGDEGGGAGEIRSAECGVRSGVQGEGARDEGRGARNGGNNDDIRSANHTKHQTPYTKHPPFAGRPVLSIDGRLEDYVILKNGARLGRMDHIFKDLTRIHEAQIVQETPGVILVRVIKTAAYAERDERQLLHEFRQRVGDQADIKIEYPAALERSRTGKLRFVISRIAAGQLRIEGAGETMNDER